MARLANIKSWVTSHATKLVFFLLALSFASWVFFGVAWLTQPSEYDPWGEFPVQTVDEPIVSVETVEPNGTRSTFEIPTIDLSEDRLVSVTGTKCMEGDKPVVTGGRVAWTFVIPPGFTYEAGDYPPQPERPLPVGCTTQTFENEIPMEVIAHAETLFASGQDSVIVNIHGTNTAYRDGEAGVTAEWTTENFALVP